MCQDDCFDQWDLSKNMQTFQTSLLKRNKTFPFPLFGIWNRMSRTLRWKLELSVTLWTYFLWKEIFHNSPSPFCFSNLPPKSNPGMFLLVLKVFSCLSLPSLRVGEGDWKKAFPDKKLRGLFLPTVCTQSTWKTEWETEFRSTVH